MVKKILLVMLTLVTVMLASCNINKQETICGTWVQYGKDNSYTFYADGSGIHDKGLQKNDIRYEINKDIITIYDKDFWVFDTTEEYFFEFDDDTLKMTDGTTTMVFSRQQDE